MPILSIDNLVKSFGGLMAVSNVNLSLEKGELVGLIGPNGAGKTTIFNLLTGVYTPTSGTITLSMNEDGAGKRTLNRLKPYHITKLGLARTFQNIRLFNDLTVLDNVKIAMNQHVKYGLLSAFFRIPPFYKEEHKIIEKATELLNIIGLADKKNEFARNLPYGAQRRLEVARALATEPSILLLDEPAAGMNPHETQDLTELIQFIRKQFSLTILLIEHDMSLVMKICERIYVLDYGMVIAEGQPEEIKANRRVIEAYLGEEV